MYKVLGLAPGMDYTKGMKKLSSNYRILKRDELRDESERNKVSFYEALKVF